MAVYRHAVIMYKYIYIYIYQLIFLLLGNPNTKRSTANGNSVFKLGFTLYKNKPARDNTHVSRKFHISQCLHPHAFNMSDPLAFILVKFCKCQSIKSCQLYVNVNKVNMLLQR